MVALFFWYMQMCVSLRASCLYLRIELGGALVAGQSNLEADLTLSLWDLSLRHFPTFQICIYP